MPSTLLSATELSYCIQSGQRTASDAVDDALRRIRARNNRLNAIVTLDEPGARRQAQEADAALERGENWGPLHGVPMTVKDQFDTKGMRTTYGLPPYWRWVPKRDATIVARLKKVSMQRLPGRSKAGASLRLQHIPFLPFPLVTVFTRLNGFATLVVIWCMLCEALPASILLPPSIRKSTVHHARRGSV